MKSVRVILLSFCIASGLSIATDAQVSITTDRYDNSRSGQNLNETILTPANVNSKGFGKLFSYVVDGYVYAQALYVPNLTISGNVHNVVFVATEHDSVYAFDADSNSGKNASPLWHRTFINPAKGITTASSTQLNCTDIQPEVGITSTPVIDPTTGTIYLVVATVENSKFVQRLHALNILTGAEQRPPTVIWAQAKGTGEGSVNGVITFTPSEQVQRAGLLLLNGALYITWASYCDNDPWHGWLMAYNEATLKQIGSWNTTPNGSWGGIWQSGTGIAADSESNIYFATGNGTFDANVGGVDYGDSVVKLATPPVNKQFQVLDYFTPFDQASDFKNDGDVGSGGVLLLPDQGQSAPHQHLLLQAGKQGSIFLIDGDNMGHYNNKSNHQIVQDMQHAVGGLWSTPAWWNNYVYFGGQRDYLKMYSFDPTTGLLSTTPVSQSPTQFGFPGPTAAISANGTSNGIVWAIEKEGNHPTSGTLHVYDATNLANEIYNTNQNPGDSLGNAVKFSVPTVANGKVYVPALKVLNVYGLFN